jgi:cell wall-associated NlpC family hydrolase
VATPHAVITHARHLFHHDSPAGPPRRAARARAGLLAGATAVLTFTVLPGTAGAEPGEAATLEQATVLVADASHELEVIAEELNTAKVHLERSEAAVARAEQDAADAEKRLDALDAQIRELARTAYTGESFGQLDILLTSDSVEDFVSQLGTLDAIAGHTNDLVSDVASAADQAQSAQDAADEASAQAQKAYDDIASQQKDLESQIADYQAQYAALSAPQQQQVSRAHGGGESLPVPTSVAAPSGAAQVAVNTALAQVGDPYVYGAGGPDAFDCSGLTQYAYSAAGVSLPHSSASQSRMGTPVSRDQLQPGDLVFFYSPVSHVGMYIGNGQMVHASTFGQPVIVSTVDMKGYVGARRLVG